MRSSDPGQAAPSERVPAAPELLAVERPAPGGRSGFRPGPRRADDRRVAVASVVIAAGYLAAAAATVALSAARGPRCRRGCRSTSRLPGAPRRPSPG